MFKKYQDWKRKPITWGAYLKMCEWSVLVSMVAVGAEIAWLRWDRIKDKFEEFRATKNSESDDIDDEYLSNFKGGSNPL